MFRFTIRDVLLVMVIVAVCVAWWIDRSRLAARVDSLESNLLELTGKFRTRAMLNRFTPADGYK